MSNFISCYRLIYYRKGEILLQFFKMDARIEKVIKWIEVTLAIIIVLTVMAEGVYIVLDLLELIVNHNIIDQSQKVLGDFLVLVVSLEFAIMLIRKNPFAIIDIIMIALARKVVLEYKSSTDYLLAVITIAILFLVRKTLVTKSSLHGEQNASHH